MKCPIATWRKRRPDAPAIGRLTYRELDALIDEAPPSPFIPLPRVEDIASFFAAWRKKVAVFPINRHLPLSAIEALPNPPVESGFATLLETGSRSKIVCHKMEAHLASARAAIEALGITEESRYRLNLPLFHVSGIATLMRTFLAGAHLLLPDDPLPHTHVSMVPTQLYRLLKEKKEQPHLECLLIGGAPLPPHLKKEAFDLGLPLFETYGMSESASMAALAGPGEPMRPLPHIDLRVVGGEIQLNGPSLFHSYLGKPARKGWFQTQDLATLQGGVLALKGRKDRQFISGGENIQPEEIERIALEFCSVIQARVTPHADEEYGMRPHLEIFASNSVEKKDLEDYLRGRLARYKVPDTISISLLPLVSSKQQKMAQH